MLEFAYGTLLLTSGKEHHKEGLVALKI